MFTVSLQHRFLLSYEFNESLQLFKLDNSALVLSGKVAQINQGWRRVDPHIIGNGDLIRVSTFIGQSPSIFLIHQHGLVGQLQPDSPSLFIF
jgi:hypothetical protein